MGISCYNSSWLLNIPCKNIMRLSMFFRKRGIPFLDLYLLSEWKVLLNAWKKFRCTISHYCFLIFIAANGVWVWIKIFIIFYYAFISFLFIMYFLFQLKITFFHSILGSFWLLIPKSRVSAFILSFCFSLSYNAYLFCRFRFKI